MRAVLGKQIRYGGSVGEPHREIAGLGGLRLSEHRDPVPVATAEYGRSGSEQAYLRNCPKCCELWSCNNR